jgi:hypothetical protein
VRLVLKTMISEIAPSRNVWGSLLPMEPAIVKFVFVLAVPAKELAVAPGSTPTALMVVPSNQASQMYVVIVLGVAVGITTVEPALTPMVAGALSASVAMERFSVVFPKEIMRPMPPADPVQSFTLPTMNIV